MTHQNTILKTYRKEIWTPFMKGISTYNLIQEGDCVGVCISGGKDSMLMALCFSILVKHSKIPFTVKYLVMDPGYAPSNREQIQKNADVLGLDITIFDATIFDYVDKIEKNPCYLCARMRRGHLYEFAESLGCNKIALGHHYDDVIETIVMNMFYGGQVGTMMPRLKSTSHPSIELIRPLYLVREASIVRWVNYTGLTFLQCACRFTEHEDGLGHESKSKRKEIKTWIQEYKKINPFIEANIFRSVENVNLNKLISYFDDEMSHHFLEGFNEGDD